jgi:probable HAF family extracellular repeat protein
MTIGQVDPAKSRPGEAFQVNSSGEVVGYAPLSDGCNRCFDFRNRQLHHLPTLGGDWRDGNAINDFGEVVGPSSPPPRLSRLSSSAMAR